LPDLVRKNAETKNKDRNDAKDIVCLHLPLLHICVDFAEADPPSEPDFLTIRCCRIEQASFLRKVKPQKKICFAYSGNKASRQSFLDISAGSGGVAIVALALCASAPCELISSIYAFLFPDIKYELVSFQRHARVDAVAGAEDIASAWHSIF